MILSREQVENIKTCLSCGSLDCHTTLGCKIQLEIKCTKNTENLIDTIRYLQQELDRRELEHEKARRVIEVLEQIRDFVWDEDIPHPTVPEYVEHHESIQGILKFIDKLLKEMEGEG